LGVKSTGFVEKISSRCIHPLWKNDIFFKVLYFLYVAGCSVFSIYVDWVFAASKQYVLNDAATPQIYTLQKLTKNQFSL
jgi:hypothetical protein